MSQSAFTALCYHRITDDPAARSDPFTVRPSRFRQHMAWLARLGWHGVSLSEALLYQSRRSIALTFDDGTADFREEAWPVLAEFGFTGTIFVVTDCVGQTADWPEAHGARCLSWADLRTLFAQGMEIGAHGTRHVALDALPAGTAQAELVRAWQTLHKKMGHPPAGLAYPYGRCSEEVAALTPEVGFAWGCTARGGRNQPDTPRTRLRRTLIRGTNGPIQVVWKTLFGYAQPVDLMMDVRRIPG